MQHCCPICRCDLARADLNSTKFENRVSVLRCERCDYTTPCSEREELGRGDALLGLAERCVVAGSDRIMEAVSRLRRVRVTTQLECSYCASLLEYQVAGEHLDCRECGYQEHLPKDVARRVLASTD